VNASIDDLARQAMAFVSEELATIENLVAGAEDRSPDIRDALEKLKSTERSDLSDDRI
jgi:hypothetical protein